MKTMKCLIFAIFLTPTLGPVSLYAMDQRPERNHAAAAQKFTPEQVAQANRRLWTAICSGSVGGLTQALMDGADVINKPNQYGYTPLLEACFRGHTALIKLLLDHGAHINQTDSDGDTPLVQACLKGNTALVELLLNRGADVNQSVRYGGTPLLGACRNGHTGIVKRLAFHGATPSGEESEAMKKFIEQAQEARNKVGDYCLNFDDFVLLGLKTPLPVHLVDKVYRMVDPLVGVQDPELRYLMKAQICKNRETLIMQERFAVEQEERARAESDFKPVGFYMSNLLERQNISEAQQADLISRLNMSSNDNAELKPEAANAIIINYLEELADSVAQQAEAERKDNEYI